jgi:hypothetical protein
MCCADVTPFRQFQTWFNGVEHLDLVVETVLSRFGGTLNQSFS